MWTLGDIIAYKITQRYKARYRHMQQGLNGHHAIFNKTLRTTKPIQQDPGAHQASSNRTLANIRLIPTRTW
jgi:hypothetical protein